MTDKELHKLKRQDLLQLLLMQSREVTQQQEAIEELTGTGAELRDMGERLKVKLNEKDEQIERLKEKLNQKDAQIQELQSQLEEMTSRKAKTAQPAVPGDVSRKLDVIYAEIVQLRKPQGASQAIPRMTVRPSSRTSRLAGMGVR